MQLIVVLFLVVVLVSVSLSADSDMDSQIFRGKDAKEGQFPYHVGLYREQNDLKIYSCGGALISETFVLTAAHCIQTKKVEIMSVYLGSIYLNNGTERRARKKIIHPMYESSKPAILNDVGLLQIDRISYTDKIKNINLPAFSDLEATYDAHIAVQTGWGYTNATGVPDILQFTYFLVLSKTACVNIYGEERAKDVLCAGDPDMSASCSGDSGSPLVDVDSKTLIGVHSFGPGKPCGRIHFRNGLMRVTSYRQWIKDHTGI